jgi:PAS domain S-box-containing protein
MGYEAHEAAQLHYSDFVHPDDHAHCRAVFSALMAGEDVRDAEMRFRTRAGATLHVEGSVSVRRDEDGEIAGTRGIFRDLSARRSAERTRDEFLAMITHDLRTPLTSLHGAIGLLARGYVPPGTPEARELLGVAYESTQRLVRLADDFLDVGRLEAGAMTFRTARVGAIALLERACSELAAMAEQAGVTVAVAKGDTSLAVVADPDRVVQVLVNLLSNAIKFSSPGATVTLEARRNGHELVFSVADTGRGIPEAMHDAVFERYGQVLPGDATELGGSGLGLAICKRLVGALGGRLWLDERAAIIPAAPTR